MEREPDTPLTYEQIGQEMARLAGTNSPFKVGFLPAELVAINWNIPLTERGLMMCSSNGRRVEFWLDEDALRLAMDKFSERYLVPAVHAWENI